MPTLPTPSVQTTTRCARGHHNVRASCPRPVSFRPKLVSNACQYMVNTKHSLTHP